MREPVSLLVFAALAVLALGCGSDAGKPPVAEPEKEVDRRGRNAEDSDVVRDEYPPAITNSIGMKLRPIPAGEFTMGSRESAETLADAFANHDAKPEWFRDEYPRHRVRIANPFYLGVYEVTVAQFRQFAAATGYRTDAEKHGGGYGWSEAEDAFEGGDFTWRDPGFPQTGDHPVLGVSWKDATAFCRWLSQKEGADYRLPTEAEWEYACRAGTTTRYYCGDDPEGLMRVANVPPCTAKAASSAGKPIAEDLPTFSSPVGTFRPNRFGLYDMHGNAWEWCADWYGKDYYGESPPEDPTGPASAKYRVLRGGSFLSGPDVARSANRNWDSPDLRLYFDGFRVVREERTP